MTDKIQEAAEEIAGQRLRESLRCYAFCEKHTLSDGVSLCYCQTCAAMEGAAAIDAIDCLFAEPDAVAHGVNLYALDYDEKAVVKRVAAELQRLRDRLGLLRTCDQCGLLYDRANGGACKCGVERLKGLLGRAASFVEDRASSIEDSLLVSELNTCRQRS